MGKTAKPRARAVGYARVSTGQQADKGVSLDAQTEKIRAMTAALGYELGDVIVDAAESGKSLSRPGMGRLLALVKARGADAVIVAKLDRLTRSVRDLCDLIDLFERLGVSLVSVAESLDTGSAAGQMVIKLLGVVAEWERRAIGERTAAALRHKKAKGERVGNVAYGFRLAADGVHLEPDPEERETIARIDRLRASGRTLRSISEELNRSGFRTRSGSRWLPQYVANVLRRKHDRTVI